MNAPISNSRWIVDAQAEFSLSQTLRRLAHRAKAEAETWLARGNTLNYHDLRQQSDRFWRDAHWHLGRVRLYREMALK